MKIIIHASIVVASCILCTGCTEPLVGTPERINLYGFIDHVGKLVIEPQYEETFSFADGLALVRNNGRYGFIDRTGRMIVPPTYLRSPGFSEGLAAVCNDENKWGYIDRKGSYAIKPIYDAACGFHDGIAQVIHGDRAEYIDQQGNILAAFLPTQFQSSYFSDGLLRVHSDGKYGYYNKIGHCVIQHKYSEARDFHEGLAWVKSPDFNGYIDTSGHEVIRLSNDAQGDSFHEGLAFVSIGQQKTALINRKGQQLQTIPYNSLWEPMFHKVGLTVMTAGPWPLGVDRDGNRVYGAVPMPNPNFEVAIDASGQAKIILKQDQVFSYLRALPLIVTDMAERTCWFSSNDGQPIGNIKFEEVREFSEGLSAVKYIGKWGYIDPQGNWSISPRYAVAGDFKEGLAPVAVATVRNPTPTTKVDHRVIDEGKDE